MRNSLIITLTVMLTADHLLAQDHAHDTVHKASAATSATATTTTVTTTTATKSETLAKNHGKKFAVDNDLKVRMEKLLELTKEIKTKANAKTKDKKDYTKDADQVVEVVNDIFKNCKLEPAADHAVHPLLAKVLDASKDLKKGNQSKALQKLHESLKNYGELFDHPNWTL